MTPDQRPLNDDPMQAITHDVYVAEVVVHLPTGSIYFDGEGRVVDGPAVLVDDRGWMASCEICGWGEGYGGDMVGRALARHAANAHRCEEIRHALDYLHTVNKENTHGDD